MRIRTGKRIVKHSLRAGRTGQVHYKKRKGAKVHALKQKPDEILQTQTVR
jgi:hypothetical protein